VTISYFINGSRLIRQQWWWAAGVQKTAQLVVADSIQDFQASFADLTSVVTFNLTFAPKYSASHGTTDALRQATRIFSSTSVRNARHD